MYISIDLDFRSGLLINTGSHTHTRFKGVIHFRGEKMGENGMDIKAESKVKWKAKPLEKNLIKLNIARKL